MKYLIALAREDGRFWPWILKLLVRMGVLDPNARNDHHETPLGAALIAKFKKACVTLLAVGANPNVLCSDGATPLVRAIEWGDREVVKTIIECGADVDAGSRNGDTPLSAALQKGDAEIFRMLLNKNANTGVRDQSGDGLLLQAVRLGNIEILRCLLSHGLAPEMRHIGEAPLLSASVAANRVDIIELLLESEFDPDCILTNGETALATAAATGNMELASLLFRYNSDINHKCPNGKTPLHIAVECGQVTLARELIYRNADVNGRDAHGDLPLHSAIRVGSIDLVKLLSSTDRIPDCLNKTLLHLCAVHYRLDIAALLLDKGVDVNDQDSDGNTSLHVAVYMGFEPLVELLLARGASTMQKNNDGLTPAIIAARCYMQDIGNTLRKSIYELLWDACGDDLQTRHDYLKYELAEWIAQVKDLETDAERKLRDDLPLHPKPQELLVQDVQQRLKKSASEMRARIDRLIGEMSRGDPKLESVLERTARVLPALKMSVDSLTRDFNETNRRLNMDLSPSAEWSKGGRNRQQWFDALERSLARAHGSKHIAADFPTARHHGSRNQMRLAIDEPNAGE